MPLVPWRGLNLVVTLSMLGIAAASPRACAQASSAAEPTREQLQLQVSIMQDYITKLQELKQEQGKAQPDDVDAAVLKAYKEAQLKQYESLVAQADIINQAFYEQRIISRISLGLVVLVVISGIAFSALQLWQTLRVAAPLTNDVEISASRIRLTTSVIGVIVLAISLAFFYVFFSASLKIERPASQTQPIQTGSK